MGVPCGGLFSESLSLRITDGVTLIESSVVCALFGARVIFFVCVYELVNTFATASVRDVDVLPSPA